MLDQIRAIQCGSEVEIILIFSTRRRSWPVADEFQKAKVGLCEVSEVAFHQIRLRSDVDCDAALIERLLDFISRLLCFRA